VEGQLTTGCKMDFEEYPFDHQKCQVFFGSNARTVLEIIFNGTISFNSKMQRTLQYSVSYIFLLHFSCKL